MKSLKNIVKIIFPKTNYVTALHLGRICKLVEQRIENIDKQASQNQGKLRKKKQI